MCHVVPNGPARGPIFCPFWGHFHRPERDNFTVPPKDRLVHDEKFESSKRNKAGEYARTHSRGELESEVRDSAHTGRAGNLRCVA